MRTGILPSLIILLLGCDSGGAEVPAGQVKTAEKAVAKSPATKRDDVKAGEREAEAAKVEPAEPEPTFEEALENLDASDPKAVVQAVELFKSHHEGKTVSERDMRAAVDRFLVFAAKGIPAIDAAVHKDEALVAAACRQAEFSCGEPTPEAIETLKSYNDLGVRYIDEGEGNLKAITDFGKVADVLEPALSPLALSYLRVKTLQETVNTRFGEGGFEGNPDDVAKVVLDWEALEKSGGEVYAKDAGEQSAAWVPRYLRLCDRGEYQTPSCKIDKALEKSYRAFVADHGDSKHAPVVERFLAAMKKKSLKASSEELAQIASESIKG